MAIDQGIYQFGPVRPQARQGSDLVLAHEPGIADDIGGDDGGEAGLVDPDMGGNLDRAQGQIHRSPIRGR
jgi:hypothetical protein